MLCLVKADEHDHIYEVDEEVVLWMNTLKSMNIFASNIYKYLYLCLTDFIIKYFKVGPYSNRQETYTYFSLPFCRGKKESIGHYHETMGESLLGVELDFSGLDIKFRTNTPRSTACKKKLSMDEYRTFVYAIKNSYYYQMYLDDMPIWGMIGEVDNTVDPPSYKLYTHKKLDIGYNDKQVVDVNLTSDGRAEIHPGVELEFSYEVNWVSSDVLYVNRFDKYLDPSFFQHRTLVCGVAFLINFVAIYYHASRAIPFTIMLAVTAICLFVILPLTLVGTVLGRNMSGQGDYPCRW
uniref:Transmembrane 9 superfamily member n=1 Tax=Heterorhabditis bacteriophora TaxID=37862 RepID=A0A1I7XCC1_HETBA